MRATLLVLAVLAAGLFWLARACQLEAPPSDASINGSTGAGAPAIFSARDARQWLEEEPAECIQAAIRK